MQCLLQCSYIAKENAESNSNKQYNQIRVIYMSFEFKPDKKKETLNKTIRFPKDLVDRIEKQIAENDSYFSSFVIQACEYAVKELEFEYDKDKKTKQKQAS